MRLAHVAPGPLDSRAVEALVEYAQTWPGRISVITSTAEDHRPEFDVIQTSNPAATLSAERFDVVGALHNPAFAYLTEIAPTVYTSEVDRRIRTELQTIGASPVNRARVSAGQVRLDRTYRRMAKRAAGLQCNGHRAWSSYGKLNRHAVEFTDHRIRAADIEAARGRSTWDATRPLRVAFSGRLIRIKGPGTVIDVARLLPDVEFVMFGTGDMAEGLAAAAPANVTFRGFVPFDEWKPAVRDSVDVALLPHPQGDPSCTYFEMLGTGVPVIGLRNATWGPLAARGLGWAEADADGIAARIRSLRPSDLDSARARGLDFVIPFEDEARARVQHLVTVGQASRR